MGDEIGVTVKVLFFAKARELSGTEVGDLKIDVAPTYDSLLTKIVNKFSLAKIRNSILLAINEEYRGPESPIHLKDGDEIAVIPPISGGKLIFESTIEMDFIKLVDSKFSLEEVSGLVSNPSCGAVSFFVGMTKEHFEGKKVIHLEYEAYEPMAVKSIKKICEDIRSKWKVENIAIYHRIGVVPVMEASVVIAVSSVHRTESLHAVQYAIDSLKASVPIWKKEVYEMSPPVWKENQESLSSLHDYMLKEHSYDSPESAQSCYTMEEASVPPHFVQINATADEIKRRIDTFIKRKRDAINHTNVRDFCHGTKESTCARVNAVLVPRKGSKSHLRVRKVLNKWGPQTMGLDPGSGEANHQHPVEEQGTICSTGNLVASYPGIEGRLVDAERYLNLTDKPVPKDVYGRLKQIEDKILYLQSVSPEYYNWGQARAGPVEKDLIKLRKKTHTAMDMTRKIRELEERLAGNEVQ